MPKARHWIVRLEMREGTRTWIEEHDEYALTAEDAIATAAASAHPTYAVEGATVRPRDVAPTQEDKEREDGETM